MDDLSDLPDDVRLKRLRNLAKSHDANNNDIIETDELKAWIMESFRFQYLKIMLGENFFFLHLFTFLNKLKYYFIHF